MYMYIKFIHKINKILLELLQKVSKFFHLHPQISTDTVGYSYISTIQSVFRIRIRNDATFGSWKKTKQKSEKTTGKTFHLNGLR